MNKSVVSVSHRHVAATAKESILRVIHGVIELFTNVDDSYERKNGYKRKYIGKCTMKYTRGGKKNPSYIEIFDKAEGMTATKLKSSLNIGEYNSDGSRRGFVGAGLNETSVHGPIKIQTLKDQKYSEAIFNLSDSLELLMPYADVIPNEEQMNDLGINKTNQNGTKVTWTINANSTIEHTLYENLIRQIESHFMLRPALDKNSKTLSLRAIDGNTGIEKILEHTPPKVIKNIFDKKINNDAIDELNNYFGTNHDVHFVLNEIEDTNEELNEFSNHGIAIKGGKQIFELGFLNRADKNTNSILRKYSGYLKTELFDEALEDFKYTDKPKDHINNPERIFHPSRRRGIKYNHPIIRKIVDQPRKELDRFIKKIENTSQNKIISVNTKMLNKLQDFFADSMRELDEVFSDKDKTNIEKLTKDKFRVIALDLYPEEIRNVYVYTHTDTIENTKNELVMKLNADGENHIKILKGLSKAEFDKQFDQRAVFKFQIQGISPKNKIYLNFHFKNKEHESVTQHEINVKEYKNRIFLNEIEFGAKNYTVKKDSKRTLELFAQYPELSETPVKAEITIENHNCIKLKKDVVLLERFMETNYLYGQFEIESLQETGSSRVSVECNEKFASTLVTITNKDENPKHNFKIEVVDATFGEERYRWKDNILEIAGEHYFCKTIFENKSEIKSLGQSQKLHIKLFFAELFSHAFAWKYMDTFITKKNEEIKSALEGPIINTFDRYNVIQTKYYKQVFKLIFEDNVDFLSLAS